MAPSRTKAGQWAKRTFDLQSCSNSRVASSSRAGSTGVPWKRRSKEPEFKSLMPIDQTNVKDSSSSTHSTTEGSQTALLLPSIEDAVRTTPAWKSQYVVDSDPASTPPAWKSPYVVDSNVSAPPLQLPSAVCESNSPCVSPTKTPGRVAKIFGELLPVTPRKRTEKFSKKIKRQASKELKRVVCRIGTAIGLKASKQEFKSLAELRRHLLQQHRSLHKAFREMEKHLKELKRKEGTAWKPFSVDGLHSSMTLLEFTKAIRFFGVHSEEAQHFFDLMDANMDGLITFEEFKSALVSMPRDILLQDFRSRVLTKYASTHEAFKELSCAPGHREKCAEGDQSALSAPLTRETFAFQLSRLGVEEMEASLLFDIIDTDLSGAISLGELEETLREVAPSLSLEEFWHRFNMRWPNIRELASTGAEGRRRATEALFKILPAKYGGRYLDMPLGLPFEAWDILCAQLDVSRKNSQELFEQCATAKEWQGHRNTHPGYLEELPVDATLSSDSLCDLDDFFDELQLWSTTPLARCGPGMRQSYGRDVAQRLGVMKAQVWTS